MIIILEFELHSWKCPKVGCESVFPPSLQLTSRSWSVRFWYLASILNWGFLLIEAIDPWWRGIPSISAHIHIALLSTGECCEVSNLQYTRFIVNLGMLGVSCWIMILFPCFLCKMDASEGSFCSWRVSVLLKITPYALRQSPSDCQSPGSSSLVQIHLRAVISLSIFLVLGDRTIM